MNYCCVLLSRDVIVLVTAFTGLVLQQALRRWTDHVIFHVGQLPSRHYIRLAENSCYAERNYVQSAAIGRSTP